jgi:hypothetical protein
MFARLLPFVLLLATSLAQTPPADLPALDSTRILQELEALVSKQTTQQQSLRQRQISTLRSAGSSGQAAAKTYEEAVKSLNEARDRQPPFSEWRRANAEQLRSDSFAAAAQLHVRYLQAGLEYDADKPEASADTSWQYVQSLAQVLADPKLAPTTPLARDLLFKPAKDSEISQWLMIGPTWPPDKVWAPQAGNIDDILQKNIRQIWRDKRDPRLLSTWDLQIQLGEESTKNNQQAAEKFAQEQKPRLLFARAKDLAALGQPNRAATEIFSLARSNPTHPDFTTWVNELKSFLATAPSPGSPRD